MDEVRPQDVLEQGGCWTTLGLFRVPVSGPRRRPRAEAATAEEATGAREEEEGGDPCLVTAAFPSKGPIQENQRVFSPLGTGDSWLGGHPQILEVIAHRQALRHPQPWHNLVHKPTAPTVEVVHGATL